MTDTSVAIAAIVTSGIVTLVGIVVPWIIHRSDQNYSEQLRLVSEKRPTYLMISELIRHFRRLDQEKMSEVMAESFGPVSLWASDEVRELFFAYMDILPTSYGPDKNDAQDKLVLAAGESLRKQMAFELQAISSHRNLIYPFFRNR